MEITGSFFTIGWRPRQSEGFCEKHNLVHAWEPGPTYTSYPGWATRRCENCGKQQRQSLAEQPWEDDK